MDDVKNIRPLPMSDREYKWRESMSREMGVPLRLIMIFLQKHDRWTLYDGFKNGRRLREI